MKNYEKAYKEALKVMESLYNVVKYQLSSDALLTLQTLKKAFPELCESEDERIREDIIAILKGEIPYTSEEDAKRYIAWLEKQGGEKPAWSEEDEKIYNEIIDFFLGDIETRCTTIDKQRYFGYWLKSLKPHWKPSEEQIKSLRIALQTMPYSKDKENVLVILEELMKL